MRWNHEAAGQVVSSIQYLLKKCARVGRFIVSAEVF